MTQQSSLGSESRDCHSTLREWIACIIQRQRCDVARLHNIFTHPALRCKGTTNSTIKYRYFISKEDENACHTLIYPTNNYTTLAW